jgi:hypothetical protein
MAVDTNVPLTDFNTDNTNTVSVAPQFAVNTFTITVTACTEIMHFKFFTLVTTTPTEIVNVVPNGNC